MKAHNFIDISGQIFGNLQVIEIDKTVQNGVTQYRCKCLACIEHTIVIRTRKQLDRKNRQHCGCLTPVYENHYLERQIWYHMIARCTNKMDPSYANYGGRGIKVCDSWKDSFNNFIEDMGPKPLDNGWDYSLDRIDNDGNYCKENCRWVKRDTQNRNSRRNMIKNREQADEIRKLAKIKTYQEVADMFGCSRSTIKDIVSFRTWYDG